MLNIARNIYAAWNGTRISKDPLPEAEIIPIGTSANEKRRLEKVKKDYPNLQEHENTPLPGFTLFKSNRKRWGSLDPTWLIIDPRGFLVRISNENLENILHVTGITEGLIQERCVWARDDTQTKMTLIPISSDLYIEAVKNTELIEGKVDLKTVQIGDTVILQNELVGRYMGVLSLYGPVGGYSSKEEYKPQSYLRRQILEVEPNKFHYQTDLKILKVIKKTDKPLTREESAKILNDSIATGKSYFTNSTDMNLRYFTIHGIIKHASIHAVQKINMSFEEIASLEAAKLFYDSQSDGDFGKLMLEDSLGRFCLIDFPYTFSNTKCAITAFEICPLHNGLELAEKLMLTGAKRRGQPTRVPQHFSLDKFTKYYKILKHVKNETYI